MFVRRSVRPAPWQVALLLFSVAVTAVPLEEVKTVYKNKTELYEGDACTLPGSRAGICRKAALCPQGIGSNTVHCEFSVNDAVVCCPTGGGKVQSGPATDAGSTFAANSNRITAGVAKQECERLQSRSSALADHVSGNRKQVILGEFPFMAFVYFGDGEASGVGCGASLISKRFLLTAAHCFHKFQPVSVRLGAVVNDDPEAAEYLVKQVHIHEGNKRRRDDIALLELQTDVTFDSHLSPICLNNGVVDVDPSDNLTVMGWGTDGDGRTTTKLWKGMVNSVTLDQCREAFRSAHVSIALGEGQLCALGKRSPLNDEYTDTCPGDSGGPMIMSVHQKFYLVGVVSYGATCSGPTPGIYTRVSHYIDWIEQKVWGQQ